MLVYSCSSSYNSKLQYIPQVILIPIGQYSSLRNTQPPFSLFPSLNPCGRKMVYIGG